MRSPKRLPSVSEPAEQSPSGVSRVESSLTIWSNFGHDARQNMGLFAQRILRRASLSHLHLMIRISRTTTATTTGTAGIKVNINRKLDLLRDDPACLYPSLALFLSGVVPRGVYKTTEPGIHFAPRTSVTVAKSSRNPP